MDAATEISTRKEHVEQSRKVDRAASPVAKEQSSVPVADAMRDYWRRDVLSFSIPGHQGGVGTAPEFEEWTGPGAMRMDLGLSHGVDRRDRSWKVLETAQELFAEAVGAKQSLFVTNGSSMSIWVALLAVAGPGDELLLARNVHKSVAAGLVKCGAMPVWLPPVWDEELEISHGPTLASVERALDAHPGAKAVFVTTPDFYGTAVDVEGICAAAHARGVPVIVDDAWGLDYLFSSHPELPRSPISAGADIVIGSAHKTLSGLGQSSVLSVQGDLIDDERLQLAMELEQSTSVSSLLLSGIDGARRQFVRAGARLGSDAVRLADALRRRIAEEVPELQVVPVERLAMSEGVAATDPTHVMIEVAGLGITGYQAADFLQDACSVTFELMDHRRILATITFAHQAEHVDRLVRALRSLVDSVDQSGDGTVPVLPSGPDLVTQQVMRPRDAFFGQTERVPWTQAAGHVSAAWVTAYPPGVPVLMPGERITEPIVQYLERIVAAGAFIEGETDAMLDGFRVVATR